MKSLLDKIIPGIWIGRRYQHSIECKVTAVITEVIDDNIYYDRYISDNFVGEYKRTLPVFSGVYIV